MNYKQLLHLNFNTAVSAPPVSRALDQESSRQASEQGRKTILGGWIISMIGIVTYCFVMSGGDQQADLASALSARGAVGWAAVVVILIGVGSWFVGCVKFLNDVDASSAEPGDL